jgi:hypothetical protein
MRAMHGTKREHVCESVQNVCDLVLRPFSNQAGQFDD